jgi:DinB superfamily
MKLSDVQVFPHYYESYFILISPKMELMDLLIQRKTEILEFYNSIPDIKWAYQYAAGKWSIKKLVRHIIDAELIFCYRSLCFVRNEKNSLPGWSEDEYADAVDDSKLSKENILKSLTIQLDYTIDLFSNFSDVDLKKIGTANNLQSEVGAIGFCIVAHELHHRNIIKERYLNK